jgi:hypothetical protein
MTSTHRAPLSSVLAQLGRALPAASGDRPIDHDPIFLPDFPVLTPDLVFEMDYGKGHDR